MIERTWLITGVSSGLGRAIATAALAAGDVVAGTVRGGDDAAAFEALSPGKAHAFILDMADLQAVARTAAGVEARLGQIDVLVNNAGYGLISTVEEASDSEILSQFQVNVFGPLALLRAVLPGMRARRAGRILNITSVSGLAGWGGTAIYCAAKHALEGAGKCLAQEVAELGIKVTNVAPGGLRTEYAGRSLKLSERTIDDYDGAGHLPRRVLDSAHGGDPAKAAAAILAVAAAENPPMHLLLGQDAIHYATRTAAQLQSDLGEWIGLTAGVQ